MDDKKIVEMLFERDEKVLSVIRERYGKAIYSLCYNVLKNCEDAEECTNDCLLALWNAIPPHNPEHLLGFTLKIARNLAVKKLREKTAKKRGGTAYFGALSELEECIGDGKDIEDSLEEKHIAEVINSFLHSLKKEEGDIFVLRYFYLFSVADISQKLGVSKSKIKTSLFRTRQKLSIKLEKEGVAL